MSWGWLGVAYGLCCYCCCIPLLNVVPLAVTVMTLALITTHLAVFLAILEHTASQIRVLIVPLGNTNLRPA